MISLIVPLYVNDQKLYPIISRFFDSIPQSCDEVIIVNDASPLPILPEWKSRSTFFISRNINKGYTETVNRGLECATGDILIISNDDIVLTQEIVDRFSQIEDGIYSPKTTDEGDGDKFGSIWGMQRSTFNILGYLDNRLKHFFSDTEYYERAKKKSIPIVKWDDCIIEHEGSATYNSENKSHLYYEDEKTYRNIQRETTT